jgi:hypothetical protein
MTSENEITTRENDSTQAYIVHIVLPKIQKFKYFWSFELFVKEFVFRVENKALTTTMTIIIGIENILKSHENLRTKFDFFPKKNYNYF